MAIATYADVLTAIRDWLARPSDTTTLPDARLGDLVVAAETEIWDRLRVRDMMTTATLSVAAQSVAAPSDLLEVSRMFIDGTPVYPLEMMAPPQFWPTFSSAITGRPRNYTLEGSNFQFGPPPDATYSVKLSYFARQAPISTATNAVFLARPTMWVYGALAHSEALVMNDARIAVWRGMFEAAVTAAQAASDRAAYSGAPLRMRVG